MIQDKCLRFVIAGELVGGWADIFGCPTLICRIIVIVLIYGLRIVFKLLLLDAGKSLHLFGLHCIMDKGDIKPCRDFKRIERVQMQKWTEEKITSELKELYRKYGKFPSAKFLQDNHRGDLFGAIGKNGGFTRYRQILGCNITPNGYWKTHYEEKIKKIVDKIGRFPTSKEIRQTSEGLFDFLFSHNLLDGLRKKYNYQPTIKPVGYWNDFNNLKSWLIDNFGEIIKAGIFPSAYMLRGVSGGYNLISAISKHGGFKKVAALMNCKPKINFVAPDGHYLDSTYELILDWYLWNRNIRHEVHGYISKNCGYKYDFKLDNDLYVEVWGYVGYEYERNKLEKQKLYQSLNLSLISIEKNVLDKPYQEMEKCFDDIFSRFGIDVSKKRADYVIDDVIRGKSYWTFENTFNELKSIIAEHATFPSVSFLRSIGKYQIQKSMQKYGGQDVFRSILGFPKLNRKKHVSV